MRQFIRDIIIIISQQFKVQTQILLLVSKIMIILTKIMNFYYLFLCAIRTGILNKFISKYFSNFKIKVFILNMV